VTAIGHLWTVLAAAAGEDTALHLPMRDTPPVPLSTLMRRAEGTACQVLDRLGARPRLRLGILMANGEPWVRGMLATLRLDGAVVPLPLPVAFAGVGLYVEHLRRVTATADLDAILVDGSIGRRLQDLITRELGDTVLIDITEVSEGPVPASAPGPGGDTTAVIQFTSGSTSAPKGVVLSHGNVLAGLEAIAATSCWRPDDTMGLWLPLFHDMGLFSLLAGFSQGSSVHLWRPADFIRRPMRWLASFAASGVTGLPAPNFFYDLLVAAAKEEGIPEGLDLTGWRAAGNGAEPVQGRTLAEFAATFAPYGFRARALTPLYGMAEATLIVTGSAEETRRARLLYADRDQLSAGQAVRQAVAGDAGAREVVSCGPPVANLELRIADEWGTPYPDRVVGEIQLRGPAVTRGYLGVAEPDQPFTADGWLRTGDLAFLDEGEVFVVGRSKDVIIVRGTNFYAEDVEEIVRTTPGLDRRNCAAFSWATEAGEERIAVLWETGHEAHTAHELALTIRARAIEHLGLDLVEVVPVAPSAIPFTTSGKVKRHEARKLLDNHGPLESSVPTSVGKDTRP
jgi:fatty-acyl-CoA synthase